MAGKIELTKHRITVLLVDDQKIIGEAVRRMFTGEEDIDFHYCDDPTKAIKIANQIAPTVILQDLVMPEMDGLRLVRYFRANPTTRQVPLIVLSVKEEPRTKAEAFALGANDYMVKLPDRLEVLARVRYHSRGYINLLERNEAYNALLESQKELELKNQELKDKNLLIQRTFGRFLSHEVVKDIIKSEEMGTELTQLSEKRLLTILMSDLRGFTTISERLNASGIVSIINIYLKNMTEIITKYQGIIDEFIGDAILVIFGTRQDGTEDHAKRAVACAIDMQLGMENVNREIQKAGARQNMQFPAVEQGIGVHTGISVVGNIGSKLRYKYGVVGRNVNFTSRIESYTVGGQILISHDTKEACGDILKISDELTITPKGFKQPITIYEIRGIGDKYNLYLEDRKNTGLIPLENPLHVNFQIIEGKFASKNISRGKLVCLNQYSAQILSDTIMEKLMNLRISIFDYTQNTIADEIYAKVVKINKDDPYLFTVKFTSVPPEAEIFFKSLEG